ncbi:MAG: uroporphyrinogen-III C-methyltransferase [Ignavibacteriaceae bacterium]|nr:uroporphyrinogen-III C-methyltransferase [Ignavibacteriaceae bacterium]
MKNKSGKIFLIGAGPGDKGLITVNALEKLKVADVVVYDRLINDELLSSCKKDCELIFVGKESGFHPIEQEKITEILIAKSKQGNTVVRLKGGNPFIFGRGSEEAVALKKENIDFEIIPGITSGLAAPVYCGIPITQRGEITQCVFITAHECPEKPGTQVEWEKLAKLKNTSLIIYMGASRIETISKTLIKFGMDPATPAAAIENATLPIQRTISERLDKIPELFREQNFHAPVIIVISPTISLREDICWFEKKPLFNKRIVVAGADEESEYFYNILSEYGAEVLYLPVMKTYIKNIKLNFYNHFSNNDFEWLLFSGELEVKYFFELLQRENLDSRILGNKKIAAIGHRTANKLKFFNLIPDYSISDFEVSSFNQEFVKKYKLKGKKILRIQNDITYDRIHQELVNSDVTIEKISIFDSGISKPEQRIIEKLNQRTPDVLIFTQPASIDYFFNALGVKSATEIAHNAHNVIIDPITSENILEKNIKRYSISTEYESKNLSEFVSKLI